MVKDIFVFYFSTCLWFDSFIAFSDLRETQFICFCLLFFYFFLFQSFMFSSVLSNWLWVWHFQNVTKLSSHVTIFWIKDEPIIHKQIVNYEWMCFVRYTLHTITHINQIPFFLPRLKEESTSIFLSFSNFQTKWK